MKNTKTIAILEYELTSSKSPRDSYGVYQAYESFQDALDALDEEIYSFICERIFVGDNIIRTSTYNDPTNDNIHCTMMYEDPNHEVCFYQTYSIHIIDLVLDN